MISGDDEDAHAGRFELSHRLEKPPPALRTVKIPVEHVSREQQKIRSGRNRHIDQAVESGEESGPQTRRLRRDNPVEAVERKSEMKISRVDETEFQLTPPAVGSSGIAIPQRRANSRPARNVSSQNWPSPCASEPV